MLFLLGSTNETIPLGRAVVSSEGEEGLRGGGREWRGGRMQGEEESGNVCGDLKDGDTHLVVLLSVKSSLFCNRELDSSDRAWRPT